MSNISEIFDAVNTRLDLVLATTHKHLADPYTLEDNDDKSLNRGYAWFFASADNTELLVGCNSSIRRQVTLILTVSNKGSDRDRTIRQNAEKTLLEDLYKIVSSTEGNTQISDKLSYFRYVSDSGIEQLYTENNTFLTIRCIFEMQYLEEY